MKNRNKDLEREIFNAIINPTQEELLAEQEEQDKKEKSMSSRNPFDWVNEDTRTFMKRGYLDEGQTVEERVREIGEKAEEILGYEGFADEFEHCMGMGWFSLSTPIWVNFGKDKGLPISCYGTTLQDDVIDILRGNAEIGAMSKVGGGTATYFGELRPRGAKISTGGETNGAVSMMELFNTTTNVISQGKVRRGSWAAYLPVDHGDIEEFLQIRSEGHPIQDVSLGVCIPNYWMEEMIGGDMKKREIMAKIHKKRSETGYPYIFFTDTVNHNKPRWYRDKDMEIKHSQLCAEIMEYTDENKSFVCCLSSMNLLHYDEWRSSNAVRTLTCLLEAVYTEFIEKAEDIPFLEKAVRFAKEHRSIGIGGLGYHSYLQKNRIPFESLTARTINKDMFETIDMQSRSHSMYLSREKGEPAVLKGYNQRFSTRMAVAPTTSSSFILGQVSPSIEPLQSNYFTKDLAKGKFTYKNPYLKELLIEKDMDTQGVWRQIMLDGGSVQGLDFLSQEEKDVFKTFGEISQMEIIQQAADRQRYIDQGQSLNVMIGDEVPLKDINKLVIEAWKLGIKTLYYQRGANMAQQVGRDILNCAVCEG
jgi:ribonucleoside-diphosphate reductase alpha chain